MLAAATSATRFVPRNTPILREELHVGEERCAHAFLRDDRRTAMSVTLDCVTGSLRIWWIGFPVLYRPIWSNYEKVSPDLPVGSIHGQHSSGGSSLELDGRSRFTPPVLGLCVCSYDLHCAGSHRHGAICNSSIFWKEARLTPATRRQPSSISCAYVELR